MLSVIKNVSAHVSLLFLNVWYYTRCCSGIPIVNCATSAGMYCVIVFLACRPLKAALLLNQSIFSNHLILHSVEFSFQLKSVYWDRL